MSKALSCIIVDDEPLAVKLLESFVTKTPGLELIDSFTDSVEAINAIKNSKPNLLFLDVQMPDLNGIELAHMVPEGTKVIFTTAFKEYAYESYEVSALDFLLKPIRYNKFLVAIDKAKGWFCLQEEKDLSQKTVSAEVSDEKSNTIFVKSDGQFRQINLNNLLYVSGLKDYVIFHLSNEKNNIVSYLRMNNVEDMLPKDKFMRVHRSYIVALDKIIKIDKNDCIYIGDEIIHVTNAYQDSFHNFMQRWGF
jgi:DNA-binding LytR/AlgR family response regulator